MHKIHKLANGITVVLEEITFVRSFSFGIWIKNGSRNENKEISGISHFIEHMMFKGTKTKTAKMIADQMDSIGGMMNAFTSKECTCYYAKTLDTRRYECMEIISDMFLNSKFDEEDIKKERGVILEEISMYEDSPEDVGIDLIYSNAFKDNSMGYPILGTRESISTFDQKTFLDFYKNNYTSENIVIAVAGNFYIKEIIQKLERIFENFKYRDENPNKLLKPVFYPCIVSKSKDIEQVHLNIAFSSVAQGTDESYDLSVFNSFFGGGMSSILFQKIREENGLAYSVYSQSSNYIDTGVFSIYAALNPQFIDKTLELIAQEIQNVKKNKISEELLSKSKEQLKSNYILSLESSVNRMTSLGRSMVLKNSVLTPDEIIDKIDDVTIDRIFNTISTTLEMEKAAYSLVGKIDGIDFKGSVKNVG